MYAWSPQRASGLAVIRDHPEACRAVRGGLRLHLGSAPGTASPVADLRDSCPGLTGRADVGSHLALAAEAGATLIVDRDEMS